MQTNHLLIQERENHALHFLDLCNRAENVSSPWQLKNIKVSVSLFVISILLSGIDAIGADWKFLGGATLPNGQQAVVFYDAESVEYIKDKTIKVWTKSLKRSDLIAVINRNEIKVMEKSAAKQKSQYHPPYTLENSKTQFDDYIEIISWEAAVTSFKIKARAKVLFEIKCAANMIRTLSINSYKYIGDIESTRNSSIRGAWEHISPKSNADTLQKILCK
jgi:hypothetical protein